MGAIALLSGQSTVTLAHERPTTPGTLDDVMIDPAGDETFTFTGLTGRPSGPVVRALSGLLPGVAGVQAQIAPFAEAWRERNLVALRGTGVRWVALGDSMTQGIGASAPEHGWVGQLAETLSTAVDIINLSQSGARVEDVLDQQLSAWRALPPAAHGEFITLLIGSNDIMSPVHRRLLPEAMVELLEHLPESAIVSAIPSPAPPARQANEAIAAAAARGRIHAVTPALLGPASWRGKLASDRFHPNDAGYAMIAEVFAPAVGDALAALASPGER